MATDVTIEMAAAAKGAAEGAAAQDDALLAALLWLTHHHGVERTPHALLACLGIAQRLTPPLALRVLQEAGFQAALLHRAPDRILALLLPAILLLRDGQACVLLGRVMQGDQPTYRILLPQADGRAAIERLVGEAELLEQYSGDALIASPALAGITGTTSQGVTDAEGRYWLWSTMRRYVPYYRGAMLAALLSNVLMLFIGLFTSVVYDRVIPHQALVTMWSLAVGVLIAIGFDLVARQLRSYLIDLAGKKADLALGALLFRKASSIRLEHRPESAGSFAHHLAQMEIVREFSTSATMSALSDLPFIFLFIGATWLLAGELVLVLVLAVPLLLLMTVGVQHLLRRAMTQQQHQHADMQGLLVETMDGIETVRACGAQGYFQARYEQAHALAAESSLRARSLSSWVNNVTMVAQQLVTVLLLVWGVMLIHDGRLSGGGLIAAVILGGRVIAPLGSLVALASRYQGARAALKMLDQLMSLPSERDPTRHYLPQPALRGQLGLREVSFGYMQGHAAGPTVLKGVQLRIAAGERVAILGKIGSGKSTVLRLLAGLYQPTEGYAEVDGIDLRQIDPADYHAQLGFVEQEPRLFRGSLRDNILLGRGQAAVEALPEVLRLTGLDRIAAAHPAGLDMPVGEGGAMLSGGQRQLVALARCLVTRPRILLMDEPTSSMDAQTEQQFIQQLRGLIGGSTLVVVTHRPALLELVDRIVVVDNGRIVVDGPKQAVLTALAGQQRQPVAPDPASPPQRPTLSAVQ